MPEEQITLNIPDSLGIDPEKKAIFRMFAQSMIDRLIVGELRYGPPRRRQRYMTRMWKEMQAYIHHGNAEQLINIANYCVLEWIAPEHSTHHFDNTVDSVTRKKGKG